MGKLIRCVIFGVPMFCYIYFLISPFTDMTINGISVMAIKEYMVIWWLINSPLFILMGKTIRAAIVRPYQNW